MIETNPEYDAKDYMDDEKLYSQHASVNSPKDLMEQRGTPIPALFNQFYKFIQNPSTVSVETFKRMVDTDDVVGSGIDFLTSCLGARLGSYEHPSQEVTEFVNKALAYIDQGWNTVVKEGMSALWAGHSVQEKVWTNADMGFVVKKLKTYPPTTILYETERDGDLTPDGILQYQRNYNPQILGQGLGVYGSIGVNGRVNPDPLAKVGDFPFPLRMSNSYSYLSIRIPTFKCVHYAHNSMGNPYGHSLLRRAYKYWVLKDSFLKMMAVALDRKGTPLTIVYADPNATMLDARTYQQGVNPNLQNRMRADLAARQAFANVHNDSTIILPGKKGQIYDTDFAPQDPNTSSFLDAIRYCDQGLLRALLVPSLIFTNGDGTGSYSLGQEHAKTFEKILDSILFGMKHVYLHQLVKELIAYNFPESAWKKDGIGDFSKRELGKEELSKEMEMYERGINMGVIDANDLGDLNKMRETMGFNATEKIIEKPMMPGEQQGQESGLSPLDSSEDALFSIEGE